MSPQAERRAYIFICRANGARWVDLARLFDVSVTRIRQLDHVIESRIFRQADKWFPIHRKGA